MAPRKKKIQPGGVKQATGQGGDPAKPERKSVRLEDKRKAHLANELKQGSLLDRDKLGFPHNLNPLLIPLVVENVFRHLINFETFKTLDKTLFRKCRLVCREWNAVVTRMYKCSSSSVVYIGSSHVLKFDHEGQRLESKSKLNALESDMKDTRNFPIVEFCFTPTFFPGSYRRTTTALMDLKKFLINNFTWVVKLEIQSLVTTKLHINRRFGGNIQLPNLKELRFRGGKSSEFNLDEERERPLLGLFYRTYPVDGYNVEYFYLLNALLRASSNLHTFAIWLPCCNWQEFKRSSSIQSYYEGFLDPIPESLQVLKLSMTPTSHHFNILLRKNLRLREFHLDFLQPDLNLGAAPMLGQCDVIEKFLDQQKSNLKVLRLSATCSENRGAQLYKSCRDCAFELPVCSNLQRLNVGGVLPAKVSVSKFAILNELDISMWKYSAELFQFPKMNSRHNPYLTVKKLALPKTADSKFVREIAKLCHKLKELTICYDCDKFKYNYESNPLITLFAEFKNIQTLNIFFYMERMYSYETDSILTGIPHETRLSLNTTRGKLPRNIKPLQKFDSIDNLQELKKLTISYCSHHDVILLGNLTAKCILLLKNLKHLKVPGESISRQHWSDSFKKKGVVLDCEYGSDLEMDPFFSDTSESDYIDITDDEIMLFSDSDDEINVMVVM